MKSLRPLTERSTTETPRVSYRISDRDGIILLTGVKRERSFYADMTHKFALVRHIPEHETLSKEDLLHLSYLAYLYTLRLCDTRTMRRLTTVPRDTITQTKNNLFSSLELVRYKIATMRCVVQRLDPAKLRDQADIEANFVAAGLGWHDSFMFTLLYYNNDIPRFVESMLQIEDDQFPLDVDVLLNEIENTPGAIKQLERTAGYFAFRKVAFLANANRLSPRDLQYDLVQLGIQAYRWVRPFYNKLHALNYAKRALHGQALVMIENAEKDPIAKRVFATATGYDNMFVQYNEFAPQHQQTDAYSYENALVEYLDASSQDY